MPVLVQGPAVSQRFNIKIEEPQAGYSSTSDGGSEGGQSCSSLRPGLVVLASSFRCLRSAGFRINGFV